MGKSQNELSIDLRSRCDVNEKTGCWEWRGFRSKQGYGQFRFQGKNWYAHRFAWFQKLGRIPKGHCICHRCDNPPCCNIDHLFLGTRQDNALDAIKKGRLTPGKYPKSKTFDYSKIDYSFTRKKRHRFLSDDDVREIRSLKMPLADIAKMFGITEVYVCMIRCGKRKQLVV